MGVGAALRSVVDRVVAASVVVFGSVFGFFSYQDGDVFFFFFSSFFFLFHLDMMSG